MQTNPLTSTRQKQLRFPPFASIPFMVALLVIVGLASSLQAAAVKHWNGSSSIKSHGKKWSAADNWDENAAPVNGDDLVFPSTASSLTATNDIVNLRMNSITLGASYTLRGEAVTVTNGIAATHASGYALLYFNITNAANQTFSCANSAATLIILGDLHLGTSTLTVNTPGGVDLGGTISGTGGLTKNGTGTNRLYGDFANTFSGTTRVNAGILDLAKNSGNAIVGPLIVGGGSGAAVVRLRSDNVIGNVPVTVASSGWLDLDGHSDGIGALTLADGAVTTGAGTLTLAQGAGGDLTASGDSTISGNLSLGAVNRTISVSEFFLGSAGLVISANVSGGPGVGFTKTGNGTLRLNGANTYAGLTTVSNGLLRVGSATALGAGTVGTVLAGGGLELIGVTVASEPLINNSASSSLQIPDGFDSDWGGNILLNADLGVVVPGYSLYLSGVISGTGGINKSLLGTLWLRGSSANTYTGTTTVNQGPIIVQKSIGDAIVGPLVIGDGTSFALVDLFGNDQIGNVPVTVNQGGFFDLNGYSDAIGALTIKGGKVRIPTGGTLTLGGTLTATGDAFINDPPFGGGNLELGGAIRTFNVAQALNIYAVVSGGNGITKTGDGTLRLYSANTYTGPTTINGGSVNVYDPSALGANNSAANGTVVNNARLYVAGVNIGNEFLTIANDGWIDSTGTAGWAGPITLDSRLRLYVAGGTLDLSGAISGSGTLEKWRSGTLIFSGSAANTYANTTSVLEGTVELRKSANANSIQGPLVIGTGGGAPNSVVVRLETTSQLGSYAPVTVNSSGLFNLNGITTSCGSLAGSGNVTLGAAELRVGYDNTSTVFYGVISGAGSIVKMGTGTLTCSGNNTYSSPANVQDGTLLVNGTESQHGVYLSVVSGSSPILGGIGTVGSISGNGGKVSPGNSPGVLDCGNVTFSAAHTLVVELNGTTAGVSYDQLDVSGSVALNNATLSATLGFASALNNSFTIINNDGADPVVGTFNGLPQGANLTISGVAFRISYTGGTGNDVELTQTQPLPTLTSLRTGTTNIVLSWPATYTGFTVESSTNLSSNEWAAVWPAPALSGPNYVVTSSTVDPQKFYRLRSP